MTPERLEEIAYLLDCIPDFEDVRDSEVDSAYKASEDLRELAKQLREQNAKEI